MIKNIKKRTFQPNMYTKEHLKRQRFTKSPTVFVEIARDFQTEKLIFFHQKNSTQTPHVTQLCKTPASIYLFNIPIILCSAYFRLG